MHPTVSQLHDPFLFAAMDAATMRIRQAIEREELIAVYSDYDADGVCGQAILTQCLKELGARVIPYIPDRHREGYGTNPEAIHKLILEGIKLLITVDCGIRSVEDVAQARNANVDVIILDHHECGELPDTPYILNPKLPEETYPNHALCGAGVAFKVAQALLGKKALSYLDVAGVATIGDMVPLEGENRTIARLGMHQLQQKPSLGLASLAKEAGLDVRNINSYHVSFGIVPRLNAAGRMADAHLAYELLIAQDEAEASHKAQALNRLNAERQRIQRSIAEQAVEQVHKQANLAQDLILMVAGEGWEKGVVGLAASSLASRFYRPAVVFSLEDGILTGSARSIPGVNLYDALCSCQDTYTRFGGHAQAAGLTLEAEKLPLVRREVNRWLKEHYESQHFLPFLEYDQELEVKYATPELVEQMQLLEPFGEGNPKPVLLLKAVHPQAVTPMGGGKHLRFASQEGLEMVRFFCDEPNLPEGDYTVAGELDVNEFRGQRKLQFIVSHLERENGGVGKEAKLSYLRRFPREFLSFGRFLEQPDAHALLNQKELEEEIAAHARESCLGLLLAAHSQPGAERLEKLIPLLGENGITRLSIPGETSQNCAAFLCKNWENMRNYPYIYAVGAFQMAEHRPDARFLWTEELIEAYIAEGRKFFATQEELGKYARMTRLAVARRQVYPSMSGFLEEVAAMVPGGSIKKMWFCVNVFTQLKLLEVKKSDKILLTYRDGDVKPANSPLFAAFARILEKPR